MANWKKYLKWIAGAIGLLLSFANWLANVIGKSTTPEDAQSLLTKFGNFLEWLTAQNPGWVLLIGIILVAASAVLIYSDLRDTDYKKKPEKEEPVEGGTPEIDPDFLPTKDEGFYRAKITQTDPPPFNPARLYIGQMYIEAQNLRTDLYFNVVIRAFNSTGTPIKITSLSGLIDCKDGAKPDIILDPLLNSPHLLTNRMLESIPDHSEFLIIFEQRAPSKVATLIADTIESEKGIRMNFKRLKIEAKRVGPDESFVFPIWEEITVRKSDFILQVGRVIFMSGTATI